MLGSVMSALNIIKLVKTQSLSSHRVLFGQGRGPAKHTNNAGRWTTSDDNVKHIFEADEFIGCFGDTFNTPNAARTTTDHSLPEFANKA